MHIEVGGNHGKWPCRNHSSAFMAKVALAAIKGDKTIDELTEQFDIHSNQISRSKTSCSSGWRMRLQTQVYVSPG